MGDALQVLDAVKRDGPMRIATFNLENLDLPPKSDLPIAVRAQVLRPQLARLDADILCLQEVNGQHVRGSPQRELLALDLLLEGTRYAAYERRATTGPHGGAADVHNLVTLSRFPIRRSEELRHRLVPPPQHPLIAGRQHSPQAVRFDRPSLVCEVALPDGQCVTVVNLHLRAPVASAIAGEKLSAHAWRNVGAWAEGYYLSEVRRAAQALEARLALEEVFDRQASALVVVCGDFNCEDRDTAMEILVAAEEATGRAELASRALVVLDRAIPADRRFSIVHQARPQMFDHILASRAITGHFVRAEAHNEALGDEAIGGAKHMDAPGSYHAPVVAQFTFALGG